jgi:ERCC4-type nuclease
MGPGSITRNSLRPYVHEREQPAIIIDTREQDPWPFAGLPQRIATLATGDYSLAGFESRVAVERKSKEDAYGCVGAGRRRFTDCLGRLAQLDRAAVVIECSLAAFSIPPARTRIDARMAVGSYISWSCTYRIPVFWCENRDYAERVALRFLMAFVKHQGLIASTLRTSKDIRS